MAYFGLVTKIQNVRKDRIPIGYIWRIVLVRA